MELTATYYRFDESTPLDTDNPVPKVQYLIPDTTGAHQLESVCYALKLPGVETAEDFARLVAQEQ